MAYTDVRVGKLCAYDRRMLAKCNGSDRWNVGYSAGVRVDGYAVIVWFAGTWSTIGYYMLGSGNETGNSNTVVGRLGSNGMCDVDVWCIGT